jgi:hypothetical protein
LYEIFLRCIAVTRPNPPKCAFSDWKAVRQIKTVLAHRIFESEKLTMDSICALLPPNFVGEIKIVRVLRNCSGMRPQTKTDLQSSHSERINMAFPSFDCMYQDDIDEKQRHNTMDTDGGLTL